MRSGVTSPLVVAVDVVGRDPLRPQQRRDVGVDRLVAAEEHRALPRQQQDVLEVLRHRGVQDRKLPALGFRQVAVEAFHAERENAARGQAALGQREEAIGEEAVGLKRLRLPQVDDDRVVEPPGTAEPPASVLVDDLEAGDPAEQAVRELRGAHGRVQFHVVDVGWPVFFNLGEHAADGRDQQQRTGAVQLREGEVDGLLGGALILGAHHRGAVAEQRVLLPILENGDASVAGLLVVNELRLAGRERPPLPENPGHEEGERGGGRQHGGGASGGRVPPGTNRPRRAGGWREAPPGTA